MGLPGLCGFVGEVFVVLGTWNYHPGLAIAAILASFEPKHEHKEAGAAYLLSQWFELRGDA